MLLHDLRACGLERGSGLALLPVVVDARGQHRQPRFAPREHAADQPDELADVVVEVLEQDGDRFRNARIVRRQVREQAFGGFLVQLEAVFVDAEPGAESREHRQAPRERLVERVDRQHAQAARIAQQAPVVAGIDCEHAAGQRARVVAQLRLRVLAVPQRLEDAVAHLCGGLARERDGEQRLGPVDHGEQREETLRQQFGLARAGRRLDDEAAVDPQRRRARLLVGLQQVSRLHRRPPRASSSACAERQTPGRWQ